MKHSVPFLALALSARLATAGPLSLQWSDPAGDGSPVGDVVAVQLQWDANGAWTASWSADSAHPFTGDARFNLNLFDTALGSLASAAAPQLSLDAVHDFGSGSSLSFSYGGQSAFLANWHVGDSVSTGNMTNFYSGVVNLGAAGGRDIMATQARITGQLPEPGSVSLVAGALGLLLLSRRTR
jgi:hypothetical protein